MLLLAGFSLALRFWTFGNPLIHVDDQFYLFVGERITHGAWPYVDLWDRKPVGLFLIYAAVCRMFADPVTGYQLLAWLSVSATAWLIYAMARRLVSFPAALAGAAAYAAWLGLFGGIGGQAPVFYNLPVAAAAALTLGLVARNGSAGLTRGGCAVMLLVGLALQIKYAAVFEGVYFGLGLLWAGRQAGRGPARLLADAALWIGCALAPTLAALLTYLAIGEGWLFLHANFLSVFADEVLRLPGLERLSWQVLGLVPFWLCGWIALRRWRSAPPGTDRRAALWLLGWAGAAFAGFLAFGNWFDHYVLPLLVPLCVVAALAFESVSRRRLWAGLVVGIGAAASLSRGWVDMQDRGGERDLARVTALVERNLHGRCLYVTEDLPALYRTSGSCLLTRYIFPEHLQLRRFVHALGIDQADEMRKVMARRPGVVVRLDDPDSDYAPAARSALEDALARHYRLIEVAKSGEARYSVFVRSSP